MKTGLLILSGVVGACWGSFLNVVAFRGLRSLSLRERSRCTACHCVLAWYDLIPLISWMMLQARCRFCRTPICFWYPLIEGISAGWMMVLVSSFPMHLLPALFVFSSALITTMRTDGEAYLILRWCTLDIIPIGIIASATGYGIVSGATSLLGICLGVAILGGVSFLCKALRGYEGLGRGDIELIAMIGSFLGPYGVWLTLLVASISGSLYGITLIMLNKNHSLRTPIPFGVFLALGAGAHLMSRM